MKKLFTLFALLAMFAVVGCSPDGAFDWLKTEYSIGGAVQKGPYVQGASITIQALNPKLKPTGQMYTTQTINDAGLFELDQINSKQVDIIANGFYFDEVVGKISAAPLTLRSVVDLDEGTNTNVNLLTTLVYGRIKTLVEKDGKNVAEATAQAERELYLSFGIPEEEHPKRSSSNMNIAEQGEGNGLLIAISVVLQCDRNVGELSEVIAKLSSDLADDGKISPTLVSSLPLRQDYGDIVGLVRDNLVNRYQNLGVEGAIPAFDSYLELFKDIDGDGLVDGIEFAILEWNADTISPLSQSYTLPLLTGANKCDVVLGEIDWLSVETKDNKYILNVTTNHTGEKREALIALKDHRSDSAIQFTLTQNGYGCAIEYTYDPATSDGELWLASNVEVEPYGCEYADGKGLFFMSEPPTGIVYESGAISSITIPESVYEVYEFWRCYTLAKFEGANVSEDGLCFVNIDGYLWSFAHGSGVVEYTIPEGVTSIGWTAFASCATLEKVTIPAGVTHIDDSAFDNCEKLHTITFEGTPTSIGKFTNVAAENLTINIPEDAAMNFLLLLPQEYVDSCPAMANLDLSTMPFENAIIYTTTDNKKLTLAFERQGYGPYYESMLQHLFANGVGIIVLYEEYFKNHSWLGDDINLLSSDIFREVSTLETVVLPDNITYVYDGAFSDCTSLKSITIPNSITWFGTGADIGVFEGCISLQRVYINDVAAWCRMGFTWKSNPLYYAHNLYLNGELVTDLVIPDGVPRIGFSAFYSCTSLTSVIIPDSVTEMGSFSGCESLAKVYCKAVTPPMGSSEMFYNNASGRKIYVPAESVEAYQTAKYWSEYADAIVGYDFE